MSTKQPLRRRAVIRQRQNHSQRVNSSQPKESPTEQPTQDPERPRAGHPADEVKLGIDLWHAVEFSKNGRTPTDRLSAAHRGNPSSLGTRQTPVKSAQRILPGTSWLPPRDRPGPASAAPGPLSSGGLPGGTDHLAVFVAPSRATSRTLGSRSFGVKSTIDQGWTSKDARSCSMRHLVLPDPSPGPAAGASSLNSTAASDRLPRRSTAQPPASRSAGSSAASSWSTLRLFT